MAAPASLLTVPFREVRHFQPDDCLHYEPIHVRGRQLEWTIPAHHHDTLFQFELLDRGSVTATIDGVHHRLKGPAAWMVVPGVVHGFIYAPNSTGHVVTVPSSVLQGALGSSPVVQGRFDRAIVLGSSDIGKDVGNLRAMFAQLAHEFAGRSPGRAEALHAQTVLLGLWFARRETMRRSALPQPAIGDELVRRYRDLIERQFRAQWPVHAYARRLGVTPDRLSRRCRAVAGLGALDLIHERLMLEARRLLAYTPATVTDIGHQLGFDDPGYFSRVFAKNVGQSPSAYRASVGEGLGVLPPSDTKSAERIPRREKQEG